MSSIRAYQEEGAIFLADLFSKGKILADEPGLGKTLQAIAACDELKAKSILVVCPATARVHWGRQFLQWQSIDRKPVVLHSKNYQRVLADKTAQVLIVSYDLLSTNKKVVNALLGRTLNYCVTIFDEGHYLKNAGSNRTKASYGVTTGQDGLASVSKHVFVLSGTPAPNHAGELYPHFAALKPEAVRHEKYNRLMTQREFEDTYCTVRDTVYGRQITGSKNIPELRSKLSGFLLRRRKKDVLKDLPDLQFVTTYLDYADKQNAQSSIDAHLTLPAKRAEILEWVNTGSGGDAALSTIRREVGEQKVALCADWVTQELSGNHRKLIVFAVHHSVLDHLYQSLLDFGPVRLDGRTSAAKRQEAIDKFQTDNNCRVFIGQIKAAGEAITLTAASTVVFCETTWVPSEVYQAACRAHRLGQKDKVLAHILTLAGSLDEQINRVLARKSNELTKMLD